MPLVACPHCRNEMDASADLAGQTVACPHCRKHISFAPASPPPASVPNAPNTSDRSPEIAHRLGQIEALLRNPPRPGGVLLGVLGGFMLLAAFCGGLMAMTQTHEPYRFETTTIDLLKEQIEVIRLGIGIVGVLLAFHTAAKAWELMMGR